MRGINATAFRAWTVFLTGLMIGACTAKQIDTEVPANHPANPAAEATVFTLPPNPFALNVSDAKSIASPADAGVDPGHQVGNGHTHGLKPMQPHGASPADSKQKGIGHQH